MFTRLLSSLLSVMLLCLHFTCILAVCEINSREHFLYGLSHTALLQFRRFWLGSQLLHRFLGVNELQRVYGGQCVSNELAIVRFSSS